MRFASSAGGADLLEQGSLLDDVGLAALAALGPDVVRIDVTAAVGTEIGLGLDERARIGDHVDDALIETLGRDAVSPGFGNNRPECCMVSGFRYT